MSFNIACGVSGIPIASGDEAIVFVIEPCAITKPLAAAMQNYPDSIFRPVSLPILAQYMDRGDFEPVREGVARAARFIAAVNVALRRFEREELADWGAFTHKHHAREQFPGKEFNSGVLKADRPYYFYAVHSEIFAAMLASPAAQRRAHEHLAQINQSIPEKLQDIERYLSSTPPEKLAAARTEHLWNAAHRLADWCTRTDIPHFRVVDLSQEVVPIAKAALAEKRSIEPAEIPPAVWELMVFNHALSVLSRGFAPAFYSGEDYDRTLAQRINRLTGKLLRDPDDSAIAL